MSLQSINSALFSYVKGTTNNNSLYFDLHKQQFKIHNLDNRFLDSFFNSIMDEVRLYNASEYINQILVTIDAEDYNFFRKGVLRREIIGNISYPAQRDHSAHTLYNYILGWFLFENNSKLKTAFDTAFTSRCLNENSLEGNFYNFWPFVSALHDIGYIFEGFVDPFAPISISKQTQIGSDVYNEYFDHHVWNTCSFTSINDRNNLLRNLNNPSIPKIINKTLSGISDNLKNLSDFSSIENSLKKDKLINNSISLSNDIFDLWHIYFDSFGLNKMAKRIEYLRRFYEKTTIEGLSNIGIRLLDHGVSSGLILLQATTFFFNLHSLINEKLLNLKNLSTSERELYEKFIDRILPIPSEEEQPNMENIIYPMSGWWRAWVWVTASCAIHNFQQSPKEWSEIYKNEYGPLALDEDPFAYLGILVDILQEWDRYNVTPNSIFTRKLPLQGVDIKIQVTNGITKFYYPDLKLSKNIIDALDTALADWKDIIAINA